MIYTHWSNRSVVKGLVYKSSTVPYIYLSVSASFTPTKSSSLA